MELLPSIFLSIPTSNPPCSHDSAPDKLPAIAMGTLRGFCTKLGDSKSSIYAPIYTAGQAQPTGLNITYGNGEMCSAGYHNSFQLIVPCATSVGKPTIKITECRYAVEFPHPAGCFTAVPSGMSVGTVLLILLLVGFFLFISGGSVLKWRIKKMDMSIQVIPFIDFWKALPGLVWDGIKFSFFPPLCRPKPSQYQTMA
eukprot:GAFH01000313.1.p2 GENE.GAFH01000313.1~~GAFH01000313.1.p2  ORF type:complete len:198 (-),score=16.57 GAFH01000313.1:86-679(-)